MSRRSWQISPVGRAIFHIYEHVWSCLLVNDPRCSRTSYISELQLASAEAGKFRQRLKDFIVEILELGLVPDFFVYEISPLMADLATEADIGLLLCQRAPIEPMKRFAPCPVSFRTIRHRIRVLRCLLFRGTR